MLSTDKLTNAAKNITSFAKEVKIYMGEGGISCLNPTFCLETKAGAGPWEKKTPT